MYYDPDLTGIDPSCYVDNDIYVIHRDSQKIDFSVPVYLDSLSLTIVDSINTPMSKDIDWVVTSDDYADTAMARVRAYDPDHDAILINSLTITKVFASQYKINLNYQRLYPVEVKKSLLNDMRLDVTPDLLGNMLEQIAYLTSITSPINDIHSTEEDNPLMLEIDRHKTNPLNLVTDEIHSVNTLENRNVIRPVAGAFFKDSVIVRIKDNPDVLVEGTDYKVFGLNLEKTKQTSNTSGVYNFILFLRSYVGELQVTYHAYGGDATLYDVISLNKKINNVTSYLTESAFLTANSIGNAPILQQLNSKITTLEEDMRKLLSGSPSYGDVSDGSAIVMKVASVDDDLHFYTFAELFKVDGSDDIVTADRMQFRVSTLNSKIMFDAIVSVNLNNRTDPFTVDVLSGNYPKGFVPFEDYSGIANLIRPQLRVIYNDNEFQNSGVALQIGLNLAGIIEETIVIEDLSGKESCWKLITPSTLAISAQDNLVELPNDGHIYDELNSDSRAYATLVPFEDGYLAWAGSVPLNSPVGGLIVTDLEHVLPDNINISRINKCRLEFHEVDHTYFPLTMEFITGTEDLLGIGTFIYNGEYASVYMRIWRDTDGSIKMRLTSDIDRYTTATQLDLKHVFIFTQ